MSTVFQVVEGFGFHCHGFADDIQIGVKTDPLNMPMALEGLTKCINDVDEWLGQNRLKLNQVKTQFIIMESWQQLRLVKPTAVNVVVLILGFQIPFITWVLFSIRVYQCGLIFGC